MPCRRAAVEQVAAEGHDRPGSAGGDRDWYCFSWAAPRTRQLPIVGNPRYITVSDPPGPTCTPRRITLQANRADPSRRATGLVAVVIQRYRYVRPSAMDTLIKEFPNEWKYSRYLASVRRRELP